MSDLKLRDLSDEELDQVQLGMELDAKKEAKLMGHIRQLEGEGFELQRKLGILEKEAVGCVEKLKGCLLVLGYSCTDIIGQFTAISTLLKASKERL